MVLYLDLNLLKIFENTTQIEPYLIKTDYIVLNGQYKSTLIVRDWYLFGIFQRKKSAFKGQYGSYRVVS